MKSITTNGQDSNIIVGVDIGSSKICCVIGKISNQDNKLKLLFKSLKIKVKIKIKIKSNSFYC